MLLFNMRKRKCIQLNGGRNGVSETLIFVTNSTIVMKIHTLGTQNSWMNLAKYVYFTCIQQPLLNSQTFRHRPLEKSSATKARLAVRSPLTYYYQQNKIYQSLHTTEISC